MSDLSDEDLANMAEYISVWTNPVFTKSAGQLIAELQRRRSADRWLPISDHDGSTTPVDLWLQCDGGSFRQSDAKWDLTLAEPANG